MNSSASQLEFLLSVEKISSCEDCPIVHISKRNKTKVKQTIFALLLNLPAFQHHCNAFSNSIYECNSVTEFSEQNEGVQGLSISCKHILTLTKQWSFSLPQISGTAKLLQLVLRHLPQTPSTGNFCPNC